MRESDYNRPYEDRYLLLTSTNTHFDSLRKFLLRNLPVQFTYTSAEKTQRKNEYREGKPPQKLAPWVDHLLRFTISFVGGAFVVIPMLIMSFNQSQTKSLIVISSAVVIFGLVVSLGIRVSSIETLVATATYAAVLVVFLGSTTGNGSDSP
jgi:ABC-type polysaccharide/polyol phosphate export permease